MTERPGYSEKPDLKSVPRVEGSSFLVNSNNLAKIAASGETDEVQVEKAQIESKFSDELEAIELVFGLKNFLELSERLDNLSPFDRSVDRRQAVLELTQYQFTLTHLIESQSSNRAYLEALWSTLDKVASQLGYVNRLNDIHRGIVSQVAAFKVLDKLGYEPKLSLPSEDAWHSIDLWMTDDQPVQIKSTAEDVPRVVSTDAEVVSFPTVEVNMGAHIGQFDTKTASQVRRFKAEVSKYAAEIKLPLKGYLIHIPNHDVDQITGEPSSQVVEFFGLNLSRPDEGAEAA